MLFPNYSENCRVWTYTADRFISAEESNIINYLLQNFLSNWSAHGKKLVCDATLLYNSILVFVVDEEYVTASGCSIDSSTHFVKNLEKELNMSFFNRLKVLTKIGDELKFIHYNDLKQFPSARYFDMSFQRLKEVRNNWPL
jgi:hypothetical protein